MECVVVVVVCPPCRKQKKTKASFHFSVLIGLPGPFSQRKHARDSLQSVRFGNVNLPPCDNGVSVGTQSQLPSTLQMKLDPAFDILLSLVPLGIFLCGFTGLW